MEKIYTQRPNYMDEERDEFFILPQKEVIQPIFQKNDIIIWFVFILLISILVQFAIVPLIVNKIIKDRLN